MEKLTFLNTGHGSTRLMSGYGKEQQTVADSNAYDLPYEVLNFHEGDVIYREGDSPKGLYFLESGCVKLMVTRTQSRGRTTTAEYVTQLVSAGEFFGYKSLINHIKMAEMAKASQQTTVWFYAQSVVQEALDNAHPLAKVLLQQAVRDIESYENSHQLNYLSSVEERIAYQLVVLSEKFGREVPDGISINLKLTRNELAQLASTINESLSRHLTEFKTEGLIDLRGKEILIKDKRGLMEKSGNFKGDPRLQ